MVINLKRWREIREAEAFENQVNALWEQLDLAVHRAMEYRDVASLNAILPIVAALRPVAEIVLPESPSPPPNDKAFG